MADLIQRKEIDYMKRINQILDVLIGCFIGVFLERVMYRFVDFKSHPNLYAYSLLRDKQVLCR